jgi:LPXTG-motif cell wall-anchored protein
VSKSEQAWRIVVATVVLSVAALAVPAWAQDDPYPPTTTTTRATTTTVPETTTTVAIEDEDQEVPAEEPAQEPAAVEDDEVEPGGSTTAAANFTAAPGEDAIPAGSTVSVEVKGAGESQPVFAATATVNDDGTVSVDIQIPEGADEGVYIISIVLPAKVDANGNVLRRPQVAIASIVVRRTTAAAGAGSGAEIDPAIAAKVAADRTPPVQALLDDIAGQIQDAGEQKLADAVANGAKLTVEHSTVLLDGLPVTGDSNESNRSMAAVAALGAGGAGLLLLRRRTSLRSAR